MKRTILVCACLLVLNLIATAKIWRVNNNVGIAADFTTFNAAVTAAAAGDTIHLEASTTDYATSSFTLTKRVIVIGPGYFLNPANTTTPGNAGLQVVTSGAQLTFFRINTSAAGSQFIGVTFTGQVYLNGGATPLNVLFDRCYFPSQLYFENGNSDGVTIRKSFFNGQLLNFAGTATAGNFTMENCIAVGFGAYMGNSNFNSTTTNIIRNCTFGNTYFSNLTNVYFANNIISDVSYDWVFTNCVVKNNLFAKGNQPLPGTATGNVLPVTMTNVFVGTGSFDGRWQLKPGPNSVNPAVAGGLTVGAVVTPDCGAYGATDPYRLSGIPNVPSIYGLTVPTSIPAGTASMNVTVSTRNNN
jgi:hypothetical protein